MCGAFFGKTADMRRRSTLKASRSFSHERCVTPNETMCAWYPPQPTQRRTQTMPVVAYQHEFANAGMKNTVAGVDTLRHAYALLIGQGMMESSGRYCEGRDVSECFATAE